MHPRTSIPLILALTLSALQAHESPEHTIKALNQHQEQLTATQLHNRALAHQATGQFHQAITDLQSAIAKEPKQLGHQLELTRIQLAARHPAEALHTATQARKLATTPRQRAEIHRATNGRWQGHEQQELGHARLALAPALAG